MSGISYVGRNPDTDSSVVPKTWADNQQTAVAVTTDWVNSQIATEISNDQLQTNTYVNTQDALRAHKTDVDAADTAYIPATDLGIVNGIASLDANGSVTASQVPAGLSTSRVAQTYTAASNGHVYLAPGSTHQVNSTTIREYKLADVTVPDPGYPWRPLCFGLVGGWSNGGSVPSSRGSGTGNLGKLTVLPPVEVSDVVYGIGVCTGAYQKLSYYTVLPYAASGATPINVSPITGSLELDLWACCYSLTGYVFSGTGLMFQVICVPAVL